MTRRGILKAMSINDMVKIIDESDREEALSWTVWVGGGEVNSYLLTKDEAEDIARAWKDKGYDEVVVEKVKGE